MSCPATTLQTRDRASPVPHRRQLADVSRLPRDPRPHRARWPFDERRLRLLGDAAQAARRSPAGVHRRLLRSRGSDVPRGAVGRLQGKPCADAVRSGRAGPAGAGSLRGPRRARAHIGTLRGRRRDRHADDAGAVGRLRGGDRHRRQGFLPAGRWRRARVQPAQRGDLVRRRGRGREVRRAARSSGGRAGPDGRQHRQHQGRARHRREGRPRSDRDLRVARRATRRRPGGSPEAVPRGAPRPRRSGPVEP